jgi:hypothetical protein
MASPFIKAFGGAAESYLKNTVRTNQTGKKPLEGERRGMPEKQTTAPPAWSCARVKIISHFGQFRCKFQSVTKILLFHSIHEHFTVDTCYLLPYKLTYKEIVINNG